MRLAGAVSPTLGCEVGGGTESPTSGCSCKVGGGCVPDVRVQGCGALSPRRQGTGVRSGRGGAVTCGSASIISGQAPRVDTKGGGRGEGEKCTAGPAGAQVEGASPGVSVQLSGPRVGSGRAPWAPAPACQPPAPALRPGRCSLGDVQASLPGGVLPATELPKQVRLHGPLSPPPP